MYKHAKIVDTVYKKELSLWRENTVSVFLPQQS